MGIILWCLDLSWKILGIVFGFMLLKYLVSNGAEGFKEFLATISLGLRAMGHAIRKKLIFYLRKESGAEPEGEPEKPEETAKEPEEDNTEAKDDENPAIVYMSYEDLKRVLKNGESNTP